MILIIIVIMRDCLQCTNTYPVGYAKGFYEGLKAEGEKEVMSLVRCAWAGSQKYGVLTWSGIFILPSVP